MDIGNMAAHFECLRLGALGVIDHLLNEPIDGAAVRFAMDTGVLHYCAKGVEFGCSQSKLHAVSIIESMLRTSEGLQYCCVLADRFFVIDNLLKKLLAYIPTMIVDETCTQIFRLVVSCYAKLSQKSRARDGLRCYMPIMLFNRTFAGLRANDPVADGYVNLLFQNLQLRAMN
ncbi:unnamed protein product [Microthlaspi erraticum]|uniref:Uncharacterized protein n=1 Tax=Microthlaspi erraticum TaxID=1685480 RepID=A0A6D2KCH2_9BRAS|nr:unnamed protein product [Microthlaspi erraticum]